MSAGIIKKVDWAYRGRLCKSQMYSTFFETQTADTTRSRSPAQHVRLKMFHREEKKLSSMYSETCAAPMCELNMNSALFSAESTVVCRLLWIFFSRQLMHQRSEYAVATTQRDFLSTFSRQFICCLFIKKSFIWTRRLELKKQLITDCRASQFGFFTAVACSAFCVSLSVNKKQ